MREYHACFKPNHFYHIYNRAIGSENLFREEKNYLYFLGKWEKYMLDYVNIWAYCLLPNHFHFLIQVKEENRLSKFQKLGKSHNQTILNQFRKLFISYTKSFNKFYDRTGSLFQKGFKRVAVDYKNYCQHLIHYIHHNPIHHGVIKKYTNWPYSSYSAILSSSESKIQRQKVLNLFSGKDAFITYHAKMKNYNNISHLILE